MSAAPHLTPPKKKKNRIQTKNSCYELDCQNILQFCNTQNFECSLEIFLFPDSLFIFRLVLENVWLPDATAGWLSKNSFICFCVATQKTIFEQKINYCLELFTWESDSFDGFSSRIPPMLNFQFTFSERICTQC